MSGEGGLTPQSAKAVADKVIGETVVPKKIPAMDDIDGQTAALVGALSSALLTVSADAPIGVSPQLVGAIATKVLSYGIRQTEYIDPAAEYAPAWVVDGVRQQSVRLPDPPRHTEAAPFVEATTIAPERPKHVPEHARAVRK